jgi:photosystem II stability/assembly factor-like uncharacterized protein
MCEARTPGSEDNQEETMETIVRRAGTVARRALVLAVGGLLLLPVAARAVNAAPAPTWTHQSDLQIAYDVAVADATHAWTGDAFGLIQRTTDGGLTWTSQQVGATTSHFWGIDFADSLTGWAVGDAEQSSSHGMIYGTKDGGATWTLQWEGGPGLDQLYDVAAITPKIAVAVGNANTLLRTIDGGLTWTEPAHQAGSVFSGVEFNGKVGYAVGNSSVVILSRDRGKTWTNVSPSLPFAASLMDAGFLPGGMIGWVVGFDGEVLKTVNRGRTWTEQGFGIASGMNVLGVDAIDANTVWISAYNNGKNYVARSTDSGATWVEEPIAQQFGASSISDVEFITAGEGWAVGYEGIYHRTA